MANARFCQCHDWLAHTGAVNGGRAPCFRKLAFETGWQAQEKKARSASSSGGGRACPSFPFVLHAPTFRSGFASDSRYELGTATARASAVQWETGPFRFMGSHTG